MRFETIAEYDKYIDDLNKKMSKFKKYVDEHPEKIGVQGNYNAIKYVRDELIKEKKLFIKNHENFLSKNEFEELNLHFTGQIIKNHSIPSNILIPVMQKITELNYALIRSLKDGPNTLGKFSPEFKEEFGLNVKPFGIGSFNIAFEPQIFSNKQTTFKESWNKKAFDKLFEILSCEEDIDKLNNIHDTIGTYSIVKYRELMKIIYSKELDVTFEEKGRTYNKFILKNETAKKIYNTLKGFDDTDDKTQILNGILVAVDSGKFRFGFEISNQNERINGNYAESLDDLVSNNFKKLCTLKLIKTKKINTNSGESKDYWELIDIL